jgi:hypothetical protein
VRFFLGLQVEDSPARVFGRNVVAQDFQDDQGPLGARSNLYSDRPMSAAEGAFQKTHGSTLAHVHDGITRWEMSALSDGNDTRNHKSICITTD